jgi:STE24 endopeptidase
VSGIERTAEEVRRYHRPRYTALLLDVAATVAVLALLAFTGVGDALYGLVEGLPWWAAAPLFTALVVLASALVRFPIALWRGWLHERSFGLSTQPLPAWLSDWAKARVLEVTLAAAGVLGLAACAHAAPASWPLLAAPAAALVVLLLSFVAPLVVEPLFNRFDPLDDAALAGAVTALSERAGVPVRETLVADASRRTTKVNAYVSGLARTRRVVLYDTLLGKATPQEVLVVVGHELGHRRYRHVAVGTVIGMAGAAALVVLIWVLVGAPGDPRQAPLVLLLSEAFFLLAAPFQAALSRRWEYACDRFALELVGDLGTFESAFGHLAKSNLADPAPPRAIYYWLFAHPTVPERIAAARAAAAASTSVP